MGRWRQYAGFLSLAACCLAAGLWGFTATGGALPWAKRSARALQRGVDSGGGSLVDLGRGIVVAGPIRKGGLLTEFVALAAAFTALGVLLYVYATRYRGLGDATPTSRQG